MEKLFGFVDINAFERRSLPVELESFSTRCLKILKPYFCIAVLECQSSSFFSGRVDAIVLDHAYVIHIEQASVI